MTDKQRAALEKSMWADLRKTQHGYVEGGGGGPHWQNAERKHKALMADLLKQQANTLVYPIAGNFNVFEGGLHCTAPCTGTVAGNWAIDFICKAGLGIVAVEDAVITRFSGNDPSDDNADAEGVYGWSTWYRTAAGYVYFATHQGRRYPTLRVGQRVEAGDLIGFVGDQRYRADHLHLGVTSPKGQADAKARIQAVARAPRVS
jgi:murein DD-endopeptidase MepM/ murein hydrolase activator NlpD